MRRSLVAVAAMITPILTLGVLSATGPATASAATRTITPTFLRVASVACTPGGDCAAGGRYATAAGPSAFVLTEINGTWGAAIEVPGLAAIGVRDAKVSAVSCAPGACVGGGYYQDTARRYHAFVTTEKNGQWSREVTVFSTTKAPSRVAQVGSLSCTGPGTCAAGGGQPAFVVSEVNGRWARPRTFGAAGKTGHARVSCASAGNCTAGWGRYVVSERNGQWGSPAPVPGLASPTTKVAIASLSCTAKASCAVGGTYRTSRISSNGRRVFGAQRVFVASELNGRWGKATDLPGFAALDDQGFDGLAALRCVSAGNCVAGGNYTVPADFAGGVYEPYVAAERNGHWGNATEVPGIPPATSTLCEPDSSACVAGQVHSVSCSPGGTCAVGGWYDTTQLAGEIAFVVTYKDGQWGNVTQIPGLAAIDTAKQSSVNSVWCTPAGKCVAGGSYLISAGLAGFVAGAQNGTWGQVHPIGF